jgi:alpha-1,2-mannosyltransferase
MKFIQNRLKTLHEIKHGNNVKVLTFIHPNCYDFGGGEKVLWMIIQALSSLKNQNLNAFYKINILTAPKSTIYKKSTANIIHELSYNEDLLTKLKDRFSIDLINKRSEAVKEIEMIEFKSAKYLSPFPFCTMILQIFFQMIFAFEICSRVHSNAMFDTTGLPFTYSILSFLGKYSLSAYVHYPFISMDMIADIKNGKDGVHSRSFLAKFRVYKNVKLLYYSIILKFYEFNVKYLKFIFSNSTWTFSHLKSIVPQIPNEILYPPCSIDFYQNNFMNDKIHKENIIVSFAQFRPEKNHKMQIDIFRKVRNQLPNFNVKLWLIGGVRHEDDKGLFNGLKNYVNHLSLNEHVEFFPNLISAEVKQRFQKAKVGIHTMKDEHFGISVIEMMSSGLITIAHNSAGPREDIIGASSIQVGLLCEGKI